MRQTLAPSVLVLLLLGACHGSDSLQAERACDAAPEVLTTNTGVEFVRTPDACFADLVDWPYEPRYVELDGLRQAYIDEGPADGPPVLLLHGQPTWGYLYRKMIPPLAQAGFRVIAMDHLGLGLELEWQGPPVLRSKDDQCNCILIVHLLYLAM